MHNVMRCNHKTSGDLTKDCDCHFFWNRNILTLLPLLCDHSCFCSLHLHIQPLAEKNKFSSAVKVWSLCSYSSAACFLQHKLGKMFCTAVKVSTGHFLIRRNTLKRTLWIKTRQHFELQSRATFTRTLKPLISWSKDEHLLCEDSFW